MPPKRKTPTDRAEDAPPRRSTRQRTSTSATSSTQAPAPAPASPKAAKRKKKESTTTVAAAKASIPTKRKATSAPDSKEDPVAANGIADRRQYWLMKAEPETRLENGVDVSFSIDDLAAKKEPEPWDGIRNYVARNNLRTMRKGDLAFFSHSNCKEPGIVGTMEIVREHEPDLSAHDPQSAYYDAKSTTADPKWSVVHVAFRHKFARPVTLKEMRAYAGPGGPLAAMQMMKQSRLSVSRVSGEEWAFLMGLAEAKEKGEE